MTSDDPVSGEAVLRHMLADKSGTRPEDWYLVFKARYGIREACAALSDGDTRRRVLTQALTCLTAIAPIIDAGQIPVYCDISRDSLEISPEGERPSAGDALILQHTFGLMDPDLAAQWRGICDRGGAVLIEDSAHCVGRMVRDSRGLPVADVSIHSFGVEKMLPTHFGGAVWVSPELDRRLPAYAARLRSSLQRAPRLPHSLDVLTRLYPIENKILAHIPASISRRMRAGLGTHRLMEPAIAQVEQEGRLPYPTFRPSQGVCERACAALKSAAHSEQNRANRVERLVEGLTALQSEAVALDFPAVARIASLPLMRMPLFLSTAASAQELAASLRQSGFYIDRWGSPLLYPGVQGRQWGLTDEVLDNLPITREISEGIVCLPTDLPEADNERMWNECAQYLRSLVR